MRQTIAMMMLGLTLAGSPALAHHNPGSQSNQAQGAGLWQTVKNAFWGGWALVNGSPCGACKSSQKGSQKGGTHHDGGDRPNDGRDW